MIPPGPLGEKYHLTLYDEAWETIAMSGEFVAGGSTEPEMKAWSAEGRPS